MEMIENNFVIFTPEERVKIALMDKQHEEMACIINKIYTAYEKKKDLTIIKQLSTLLNLLRVHFDYEEELMKRTKFTGYISHKLEHDRVYKKIESFSILFPKDNSVLTLVELKNIRNWFHNHIELSDKKCGEHFVAQGIK